MTTIAILGHQDHGKTTLAQAITGAGAAFQIFDGTFAPHVGAVVLAVSAPDGVMPGTREAVQQSKPVAKLVVFLTKCDMIDPSDEELIELVEMEVRELVQKYRGDGDTIKVIRGSATVAAAAHGHGKQRFATAVSDLVAALY